MRRSAICRKASATSASASFRPSRDSPVSTRRRGRSSASRTISRSRSRPSAHETMSAMNLVLALLEVILLGTGYPRPDPARAAASNAIVIGNKWFVVDAGRGATMRTHIVKEGVVYDDGDVKVTAFAVDHKPVPYAFGYRFDSHGESIVISGDTRPNANLIRYAKGADVLVLEAYLPEHFDKVDTPEVAARLKSYHTSAEEAGEIAAAANVKTLVLTHLIPGNADETFRERAARKFKGKIVVGRDLVKIAAPD